MTEPTEKWKEEWEIFVSKFNTESDEWLDMNLDMVFKAGYDAAKRSTPVVELPDMFRDYYLGRPSYDAENVHKSLTAAGINYRIKGEE